jgi:hypothetical protein
MKPFLFKIETRREEEGDDKRGKRWKEISGN